MRNAKIILLILLVVALIPYLITCFYALPFADDFCFGWTASERISFAQKFLKQYLHWNGRYTSDVLVNFHPLTTGSLLLYQELCFVSLLAMPCVVFIFVRKWLNGTLTPVLVALFFLLCYLRYQPNITEGVYWYIGLVNYHWGNLCFILQLSLLNSLWRAGRNRGLHLSASLLLLIVSVGFNEVGATLIPVYYLATLIYFKAGKNTEQKELRRNQLLMLHFGVAFVASVFVVFSPGNFTRADIFPERFKLAHSLLYASMQTIRFVGRWSLSIPFVALSLIVIAKADEVKNDLLKKTDYRILLALLVFTVFMGSFLPYMATGILGQHRTMNYIFPFFLILWIGTLISISERYQLYFKFRYLSNNFNVFVLAMVAVVSIAANGNMGPVIRDVRNLQFQQYRTEFMQRQALILKNPQACISPLKNIPNSFHIVDTNNDTSHWVDKCMKRFYTETSIVLH